MTALETCGVPDVRYQHSAQCPERQSRRVPEITGVTFSDFDCALVPQFFNPGQKIFQIW